MNRVVYWINRLISGRELPPEPQRKILKPKKLSKEQKSELETIVKEYTDNVFNSVKKLAEFYATVRNKKEIGIEEIHDAMKALRVKSYTEKGIE